MGGFSGNRGEHQNQPAAARQQENKRMQHNQIENLKRTETKDYQCPACDGTGVEIGREEICYYCEGIGKFSNCFDYPEKACDTCYGTGYAYHSGYAGFMQGGIGFPFAYTEEEKLPLEHRERYTKIAQKFAGLVTNPADNRKGFIVSQARDVRKNVYKHSPFYLKPLIALFLPKSTIAPGASADWIYGELGIMSFGIEIMRDRKFLKRLPDSMDELTENQLRGFIYQLEELSMEPFG